MHSLVLQSLIRLVSLFVSCHSETPSVRGATGAEVEVAAEGRGEGAAPGAPVVAYAISVTSLELPQAST